jgi:hypothetical protein
LTEEEEDKYITDAINQEVAGRERTPRIVGRIDDKRAPNCVCHRMHPDTLAREGCCSLCKVYQTQPEYRAKWDGQPPTSLPPAPKVQRCRHLGPETGKRHVCPTCPNNHIELKEHACAVFGACTQGRDGIVKGCQGDGTGCRKFEPAPTI